MHISFNGRASRGVRVFVHGFLHGGDRPTHTVVVVPGRERVRSASRSGDDRPVPAIWPTEANRVGQSAGEGPCDGRKMSRSRQQSGRIRNRVRALAAALAVLGTACGGSDGGSQAQDARATPAEVEEPKSRPQTYGRAVNNPSEATRVVEIKAFDDMRFEPASVELKQGEIVTFRVTNMGQLVHALTIGGSQAQELQESRMLTKHDDTDDAAGPRKEFLQVEIDALEKAAAAFTSVEVKPGETKDVAWAFTGVGPPIGCHIPGHWDGGMRAQIVLT